MPHAFVDPVTRRLKAFGDIERNDPGDVDILVDEEWSAIPGEVYHDAETGEWRPYTVPLPDVQALEDEAGARLDGDLMLKAAMVWLCSRLNIPLATARSGIAAVYRQLRQG